MSRYILFSACMMAVITWAAVTESPKAEELLRAASERVRREPGVSFTVRITLEAIDTDRVSTAHADVSVVLGEGENMTLRLAAAEQEVRLYNTADKSIMHIVHGHQYRDMSAEIDRRGWIGGILPGAGEYTCRWLADFLHGMDDLDAYRYVALSEIDGKAVHELHVVTDEYEAHIFLSDEEQPLLRRHTVEMGASAARRFMPPGVESSLRVTADFSDWRFNLSVPEETFVFTPPPGVNEVVPPVPAASRQNPMTGSPAPAFTLEMLDGGVMDLSRHKGAHIVILDFWASWCGPCRTAMPIVARVAERFKSQGVVLYAVNLRETPERARAFLESTGLSMKVPMDTTGAVAAQYGVSGIPHLVLIDKDGTISAVHGGMGPNLEQQLTQEISNLLK